MPESGECPNRLATLLGHLTVEDLSVAMTQRIQPDATFTDPPADFELPVLDPDNRLILGETLGQGGAGIVQLGIQQSLSRQVAVKRLRPDRTLPGAEVELWREAWIGGLLTHPNIVAIYDLDTDEAGKPAIVCQHVDGEPWSRSLEADHRGGTPLTRTRMERHLRILLRICDAVEFAHSRGFLHRDIKPNNVMLGRYGEVYLIDWGIAIAIDGRHGNRFPVSDEVSSISGTPCYMAPELMRDRDDEALYVGVPTDVYLIGATLFQILCGRPPHAVGRFDEMLESIQRSTFEFPASVPKEIAQVCSKALAREPAARYQSAAALGVAIAEFLAKQQAREVLREANDRLEDLSRLFREESIEGEARFELYRLFSASKFGFGAVVDVLPAESRQGVAAAAKIMVEYELDRGDPDAAEALLAEVDEISEDVVASIAAARRLKEAELETLKNYAAVGRSHDTHRGVRARFALGCLGFLLLVAGPVVRLIGHSRGVAVTTAQQIVTAAIALLGFGAVAWFSRRYLRRHAVTRAATIIFMAVGFTHTALGVSAYLAHIDPFALRVVNCYVIGMGCLVFGVLFERGMLWSAAGFFCGGLAISAVASDLVARNLVILACGVFFAVNALIVWAPRSREALRRPVARSRTTEPEL